MPTNEVLPSPYNKDLYPVLRRLNRRTPLSRRNLANDLVTAAYLKAGMQILERHLGPNAERVPVDCDDEDSVGRPLLKLLSQRAVADEVANNPDPFPRQGSTSVLRSTWNSQSDYVADLLRFALWPEHYLGEFKGDLGNHAEQLVDGPDAVAAVHAVCYWGVRVRLNMPMFRLQLLATAAAEGDPVISEALAEYYAKLTENWQPTYTEFFKARGLQLRPGISLDDLTCMLAAAAEGLVLRALADPKATVIDDEHQRSLCGTTALAIVAACTERTDGARGLTIEQVVNEMVYGDPNPLGAC